MGVLGESTGTTAAADGSARPHTRSRRPSRNHWIKLSPTDYVTYPKMTPLGYLRQTRLIRDAQEGNVAARDDVWVHNLRLTLSVANHFNIPRALMADALQEGAIGIAIAIRRFDIEQYNEFSTYAWQWMMQRMSRMLHHERFRIRVPSHLYRPYCQMLRAVRDHQTSEDWFWWWVAQRSAAPGEYETLRRLRAIEEAGPLRAARNVPGREADPAKALSSRDRAAFVQSCLAELNPRQAYILTRRYGLDGQGERTLEEVGAELDLTRERVRQVQAAAEERLARVVLRRAKSSGTLDVPVSGRTQTQGSSR